MLQPCGPFHFAHVLLLLPQGPYIACPFYQDYYFSTLFTLFLLIGDSYHFLSILSLIPTLSTRPKAPQFAYYSPVLCPIFSPGVNSVGWDHGWSALYRALDSGGDQ